MHIWLAIGTVVWRSVNHWNSDDSGWELEWSVSVSTYDTVLVSLDFAENKSRAVSDEAS